MKICSLYGAGYYYMPGTDICLKLGGYVRYQLNVGQGASITSGPQFGTGGFNTRTVEQDMQQRVRALMTIDTRQQTAYGTLRSYLLLGYSHDAIGAPTGAAGLYVSRGFVQIAGFTFGKATSYFDIFPNASFSYNAGHNFSGDSGDGGVILMSYTAQFGNGFSGTIGIEQQRRLATVNVGGLGAAANQLGALAPYALGAVPGSSNKGGAGGSLPDIVGNLRLDQSWGTWIVAAAAHDISASYYGPTNALPNEAFGHPGDRWGYAATTGFILNLPMIAPGDRFSIQAVYSQGATAYNTANRSAGSQLYMNGNQLAFGMMEDAVFGSGGQIQATTAWSVNAAFEHLWSPSLKTSIYGSYMDVSHNANATGLICRGNAAGSGATVTFAATCNPNFQAWTVGSRTEWEPVKALTFGVDVIYENIDTATCSAAGTCVITAQGGKPAGTYVSSNLGTLNGAFRVQRNFLP